MKTPLLQRLKNCPACDARRQAIATGVKALSGLLTGSRKAATPSPAKPQNKGRKP